MIDAIKIVTAVELLDRSGVAEVARVELILAFPLYLTVPGEIIHADKRMSFVEKTWVGSQCASHVSPRGAIASCVTLSGATNRN